MGYFNGILRQKDPVSNTDEVIQTYANRLQHASLLGDRKSAVKGLKSFSKDNRELVVQYGLRALLATLEKDSGDSQAVKAVLETLLVLFLRGETTSEDQALGWISNQSRLQNGKYPSPLLVEDIEIDQFSMWIADEILLSESQIQTFLKVLQEHSGFQIRLYSLQLLEALVATRPERAKESLINIPLAVSTIVQLLDDPNDPIRNETILLLMALVNNNFNIQKLVAFENTFERVFEIIEEEGGIRGSILVQDCLTLLTNLLMYNASNQKLFLETECVPKLAHLIAEPLEDGHEEGLKDENGELIPLPPIVWTEQRLQNMVVVLDICRSFVDPDNQLVLQNQLKLESSGIFYSILRLIFSSVMENPIRRAALQVVADIIANNSDLQLKFSQLDVPYLDPSLPVQVQRYGTPIPAPVALLNWALLTNSVHVFEIRFAAVHCLSSFFLNNAEAKLAFLNDQIKARSNPTYYEELQKALHEEMESQDSKVADSGLQSTPTANIFGTLMDFNTDIKLNPYSAWFAASILVSIIKDCPEARKMALDTKDGEVENGEEVLTLIQAIAGLLTANLEASDPRIAIGCLMLLSFWLYEDFQAVNDFLTDASIIKSILAFLSKNSSESSELVHGLATILIGIVYEFTTSTSPIPRSNLFDIVTKALGADNYSSKVKKFKENPIFKNFDATIETGFERDATGLPMLFFIPEYIDIVREHFYIIQRALFRGPEFEPRTKLSHEKLEELEEKNAEYLRELAGLKEEAAKKRIELEKVIEEAEAENKSVTELLAKCQAELSEAKASETEISSKLEQLAQELADTQTQKIRFEESSQLYMSRYNSLLKSLTANEETLKKTGRALAEIEEEKTKAEAGINKMSRELFLLSKQKADADARIASFEKEISKVKIEHEKIEKELQSQITQCNRINEELRAKIRYLEEGGSCDNTSSEDKSENHSKLRELQTRISEQEEENDNLLEKLRAAASVVLELRQANLQFKLEVESLQLELAKAYEDLEDYSQLLSEVNDLNLKASATPSGELLELRESLKTEIQLFKELDKDVFARNGAKNEIVEDDRNELYEESVEIKESETKNEERTVVTVEGKLDNNGDTVLEDKINEKTNVRELEGQETDSNNLESEEKALLKNAIGLLAFIKSYIAEQKSLLTVKEKELKSQAVLLADANQKLTTPELSVKRIAFGDKEEELRIAYSRIARLEGNIEALSVSATESMASFTGIRTSLQSRVDELESIKTKLLEDAESTKEAHKQEMEAKDERLDEVEGNYFDLELLMSNVEKSKEELDIKYTQMKKEYLVKIGQLQDEVENLKKALKDASNDRDAISVEFSQLEKLSNKIESELKAKEALLKAIADKGADLAAKDAIVIDIKERLASTIAQLGESAQQNRNLTKEKEDIERQFEEVKDKLVAKDESISALEQEVLLKSKEAIENQSDRKKLASMQLDKIQSVELIEKQRAEISLLKQQVAKMEAHVKSSLQQLEDERKINSVTALKVTLVHTQQVSKLEESITKTQKAHDSDLKMLEENAESHARKLYTEISDLNEACAKLREEIKVHKEQQVPAERDECELKAHEKLKMELAERDFKITDVESQLETQKEAVQIQKSEYEDKISNLLKKIDILENNLQIAEHDQNELKQEAALVASLQEQLAQIQTDKSSVNSLEETVFKLEEAIDKKTAEIDQLKSMIKEKDDEALRMKERSEDSFGKLIQEKDERITALQRQVIELNEHVNQTQVVSEELQKAQTSLSELQNNYKADKELQTQKTLKLECALQNSEREVREYLEKLELLQREVEAAKLDTDAKKKDIEVTKTDEIEDAIAEKDAEISELKARLETASAAQASEVFAAIPVDGAENEVPAQAEKQLEEVLMLCEEQQKTITLLTRRLEALDLLPSDFEEVDLC